MSLALEKEQKSILSAFGKAMTITVADVSVIEPGYGLRAIEGHRAYLEGKGVSILQNDKEITRLELMNGLSFKNPDDSTKFLIVNKNGDTVGTITECSNGSYGPYVEIDFCAVPENV